MPAAIRDALLAEDRSAFDTAYQRALTAARQDLDLTELFRCLEHWRRIALLQRDPDRFASVARRAAERLTASRCRTLAPFAEARVVLEVALWGGDSLNDDNPDAPVRGRRTKSGMPGLG